MEALIRPSQHLHKPYRGKLFGFDSASLITVPRRAQKQLSEHLLEHFLEPATEQPTKHVPPPATEYSTKHLSQPTTELSTDQSSQSATEHATNRVLQPSTKDSSNSFQKSAAEFESEFKALVSQKDYPCVAALRSYHKDDYQVGFYGSFGACEDWRDLRNDLLFFLQEQKKTNSIYLSFFAVFQEADMTEEEFEQAMWKELSYLTSEEDRESDWAEGSVKDPLNPGFRFSLGGTEFFVVGLHPQSSRRARQFSRPVLIFNVFDQFEQLKKLGQYDSMVHLNRARDLRFQGSVNPMVETYGDDWESIQFSGKANPKTWKCPFSFLKKALKG